MSPTAVPRVLLVEDDPSLAEPLRELLEVEGFGVDYAPNGAVALELLHQGNTPEVILLDLMMPVVDGHQFRAEQLRFRELATIPVVVMTGSVLQPSAFTAPVAGWLRKPFDVDELFDTLRAAMAGGSRPAP